MVRIARYRRLMPFGKLPALFIHPDQPFKMRNRQYHSNRVQRQKRRKLWPKPAEITVLDLYDTSFPVDIRNIAFHRHLMKIFIGLKG